VAFRREKYVPRGGPAGGDGGDGGDVVILCDPGINHLGHLRDGQAFRARRGQHGKGSKRTGAAGDDCEIPVPPGTMVRDADSEELLADLSIPEERVVVAAGGKGGRGNAAFATATDQAPRHSEPGRPGESRTLQLELKLIADVGLVGRPNAGKTTLLRAVTASRGKVGAYPFTTLEPNLGILELGDWRRAVLADVPGLIEGAHRGEGLGLNFLRHIERTRALAVLVDASAAAAGEEGPADDVGREVDGAAASERHEGRENAAVIRYRAVVDELRHYNETLLERPRIVVASKLDLEPDDGTLEALRAAAAGDGAAFCALSSETGEGLDDFVDWVRQQVTADAAIPGRSS